MRFLSRLWTYQNERFPLIILASTSIAVTLSAFKVASSFTPAPQMDVRIAVGFLTSLLYIIHLRFFDEEKDYDHDKKYYPTRPISRGLISLTELRKLTITTLAAEILLNCFMPWRAFLAYCTALGYSLLAAREFFIRNWIRKHFFIYNFSHYIQPSLVIIYLYFLFNPTVRIGEWVILVHLAFSILTLVLLEFARKMRPVSEENESKDTYSAQLGIGWVSGVFSCIVLAIFFFVYLVKNYLGAALITQYIVAAVMLIMLTSVVLYATKRNAQSSKILTASAIFYYVAMHLLIYFS